MGETALLTRPRIAVPDLVRRRPWQSLLAPAVGALIGGLAWYVMHHALVDDAFITLSYARNLAFHGQWGVVKGIPANTATSPLQVLLLAGGTVLLRDAVWAAGLLTALALACLAWSLQRLARPLGAPVLPYLGVLVLGTSPLLVSTIGLETYVAVALLGLGAVALQERRSVLAGAVAGLLVMCRPDLGVVSLLLVALGPRRRALTVAVAVATYLPWAGFAWWHLGSLIPDTWLFKYGGSGYAEGLLVHYVHQPIAVILSVVPAVLGLLVLPWQRTRPAWFWAGAAVLHFAALSALGTWIYHWYYGPALAGLSLVGCLSVSRLLTRPGRWTHLVAMAAAGLVGVPIAFLVQHGMVRERAPISINWATEAQYRALAATLPEGQVVQSPGEVGTLAYFCRCAIADGLSDRGYLPPVLDRLLPTFPQYVQTVLRGNYLHLDRRTPVPASWRITPGFDSPGPTGPGFRLDGSWPNPSNLQNPSDSRRVLVEPVPS